MNRGTIAWARAWWHYWGLLWRRKRLVDRGVPSVELLWPTPPPPRRMWMW